jgi:hypothetical protein
MPGQLFLIVRLGSQFLRQPCVVAFQAGEGLDEVGARHAALGDGQIHDDALMAAHFLDDVAHGAAQVIDLARAEANAHQQIGQLACSFWYWLLVKPYLASAGFILSLILRIRAKRSSASVAVAPDWRR